MIYQLFSQKVLTHADVLALVTSTGNKFTYSEMHNRINQWANYFIEQGIVGGDRVGLITQEEDHHVFVYLALDRINAVYVPFDTDMPQQQFDQALKVLSLNRLLIDPELITKYQVTNNKISLILSKDQLDYIFCTVSVRTPDLQYDTDRKTSYIMSSSGSSGDKKWIPIEGDGLLYWANVENKLLALNKNDRILSTRSPAYDAKISEYVRTFSSGACLYLLTIAQRKDIQYITDACNKLHITCVIFIASQLEDEKIMSELSHSGLKHLMVTGEACSIKLKKICEQYNVALWNCFGPTEATFGGSIYKVNNVEIVDKMGQPIVPIGPPFGTEVKYHIINDRLYIESPYLSKGYINEDQQITQDAFPMFEINGNSVRVFDTGDRFSKQDDYYIFEGRYSAEVHCKVSGVKVSPFFIEQCINGYNNVLGFDAIAAIVVIKKWLSRDKPFAYVIINKEIDKAAFLTYLQAQLKKEEFPIFVQINTFPRLLPSQKIDRKILINRNDEFKEFLFNDENQSIHHEHHSEATLKKLGKIWCELFKCTRIGYNQEFLLLGGDSLLANRMVARIQSQIDKNYTYSDLLQLAKITIENISISISERKIRQKDLALINLLYSEDSDKPIIFMLPALLGEGLFTYKKLAEKVARKFKCQVYGLSDPGIFDNNLLPDDLVHASTRYLSAIKSIQPKGPYRLLGFSFGCTLAYQVTQLLEQQNEMVDDLYLLDGFPPLYYQQLSTDAHATLLQSLINFIIKTLTNSFYAENLKQIKFTQFKKIPSDEQIKFAFDYIEKKLKNQDSLNVLHVAKRHLLSMLKNTSPINKLYAWPTLYLTDTKQDYLNSINTISHLSKISSDYRYYYWNNYFFNMTRSGIELMTDHISLLHNKPSQYADVDLYWRKAYDPLFNLKIDHFGPLPFYIFELQKDNQYLLILFFLLQQTALFYVEELQKIGLTARHFNFDKNINKYTQSDTIHSANGVVSCHVKEEEAAKLQYFLDARKLKKNHASFFSASRTVMHPDVSTIAIHLRIFWCSSHLMDLSFPPQKLSNAIIEELQEKLQLIPQNDTNRNHYLNYYYHFLLLDAGTCEAIDSISLWLAEFISIIDNYSIDHCPVSKKLVC